MKGTLGNQSNVTKIDAETTTHAKLKGKKTFQPNLIYRSTSPNTISMVPIIVTTSAII